MQVHEKQLYHAAILHLSGVANKCSGEWKYDRSSYSMIHKDNNLLIYISWPSCSTIYFAAKIYNVNENGERICPPERKTATIQLGFFQKMNIRGWVKTALKRKSRPPEQIAAKEMAELLKKRGWS